MKSPGMETIGAGNETIKRDVLHNQLISMVRALNERGIVDFQANQDDPGVALAFEKFQQYAETANSIEDAETKLLAYLEEYMLMFDAGLVTTEPRLKELDAALSHQLGEARESNFIELEDQIRQYKEKIARKLLALK